MRFAGKSVLVTGGGSGIGRAICLEFGAEGAAVSVADIDVQGAGKVAAEIAEAGGQAVAVPLDVTSYEGAQAAVAQAAQAWGGVDILVNNAGWDRTSPFIEQDPSFWDKVIAINYRGQLNCARAVLPHMVERGGGRIVNIASEAGRNGSSGEAVYSGTKGAVIAWTKALAREVARKNVLVNCVAPGLVDTPFLAAVTGDSPGLMEAIVKAIPLRRVGQPREIARVVLFIASEDASYMTGQTLSVSGGLSMI